MEENEASTPCKTDIIVQLYGMGLDCVLKLIFTHLDLKSLMNMEEVSKSWKEIIECLSIWEDFVKSQIAINPLWKKIYKLLKRDESLCPEESISFKEVPKAVYETIKRLERNFTNESTYDEYVYKEINIKSASVDKTAARHLQTDDDYIALKDTVGTIKVWSRKTCLLKTELESIPERENSFGTYAIGDKLVLYSDLDGIIHVWDLVTNEAIFSIDDLQGVQINHLHFNPSAGILMSSSDFKSGKMGSLLSLWKGRKELWCSKIQRGHFFLKYQYPLPDIDVLCILGWDVRTFGILCTKPREITSEFVQIYTHNKTFELLTEIPLEKFYQLDWTDGYLAIMFRYLINIYDVATGVCLHSVQNNPGNFSDSFPKTVGICSSMLVTCYIGFQGNSFVFQSGFHWDLSKGFFELNLKNKALKEKRYLDYSNALTEKIKVDNLHMVNFAIHPFDGSPVLEMYDFYPACTHCGLYKRGMAKFYGRTTSAPICEHLPPNPFCSVQCRDNYCKPHHCALCNLWIQKDETGKGVIAPPFTSSCRDPESCTHCEADCSCE